MESALAYLKTKHKTIIKEYQHGKDACSLVAQEITRRLVYQGIKPYIIRFSGKNNEYLEPKVLKNVSWGTHIVCCANGKVWDPIFETPVDIADYQILLFGKLVDEQIVFRPENIVDFLSRAKE